MLSASPVALPPMRRAVLGKIGGWCEAVLACFFPNVCHLCLSERATASEGYVGAGCRQSVRFIHEPFCERCGLPFEGAIEQEFECSNCREMSLHFESARAVVAATGPALEIIHRYKYQRAVWFERYLGPLLTEHAVPQLKPGDWDLIVPVPLHRQKRREREFNQAERLACYLGKASGLPVHKHLLERIQPTRTQTQLSRAERMQNVQSAFRFCPRQQLAGERIILVDDVLTTGATTSACAKLLRRNGSGKVIVWTVARGL